MYAVEVQTPASGEVVTAATLRAWLRLNHAAEDATLAELLAAAVERFEADTRRPVLSTVYRQYLAAWPVGRVVLGRGGVTAVGGVKRFLADGSAESVTGWAADLFTPPAGVTLAAVPDPVETAAGVAVSPVGYVEFTAGWADANAVPYVVRHALKLLAAHWYLNREAYRDGPLAELPEGWGRVVNLYRLGLSGDWGQ